MLFSEIMGTVMLRIVIPYNSLGQGDCMSLHYIFMHQIFLLGLELLEAWVSEAWRGSEIWGYGGCCKVALLSLLL
jgi:hypothetical protein